VDFMRVVQGSQGTLGIVPWAAVLCEPLPLRSSAFFIASDQVGPLTELAARLQRRRLGCATFIANRLQLASLLVARSQLRNVAAQLPEWILYVELSASAELPDEQIAYETLDLQDEAASFGLRPQAALADHSAAEIAAAQASFPNTSYKTRASGAYEEVFFLTTLDKVATFTDLARQLAVAHGWMADEVAVYVQPRLHGRNCHVEFVLPLSPLSADECARVRRLSVELSEACARAGAFFSRPYGSWHQLARAANPGIVDYLRQTKQFFDPDGILNPGRFSAESNLA